MHLLYLINQSQQYISILWTFILYIIIIFDVKLNQVTQPICVIAMMNYSESQDESSSSSVTQHQIQTQNENFLKIKSIWKNIQQIKNIQDDHVYKTSHKKNVKQQPFSINKSKNLRNIQSSQKDEPIQLKLKKCEKQLQKSKQNTNILMKKLTQAEQQIEYLQYQLQKQTKQKMQAIQLVEQLQEQNKLQMKESHEMLKEKSYQKQNKFERQNIQDQNQLSKRVRTKQKIIDRLQLKIKSLELQIKNRDKEIQSLANQTEQLRVKTVNKNQNQFNQNNFQGAQLLQLNQANKTIERLVKLLKSTEEYKLLANFAEQVKSIHFLQTIQKRLKNNTLNHKIIQKSACNCMQVRINQRLVWTPMMCYKKMLQMKIKYQTLNQSCIQEVLFQMNKIYLSKQETRVAKVKQYYEGQMAKIKKKCTETYDEIFAKKQIQRLKKELSGKNKNIIIETTNSKNKGQNKLKSLGQYQDQIRLKDKQIRLLQQRVKMMETQTNSYEKSLYLQGVLWIIDKTLEQLQTNSQDLGQFQTKFRQRIQSITSAQEWLMSYKQFFQNVNDLNSGLIEKILTLKENTLSKMSK